MRVFHDWEFLETGVTIDPISVGLVADDGREYYAVNADLPQRHVWGHAWLRTNVVPHLPLVESPPPPNDWLDLTHPDVRPRSQIRDEVREFLLATPELELFAWYGSFDHVCLAWLFGPMSDLPDGIPMWTSDLRQEHVRLGEPPLPRQPDGEHHALADARHNRLIAQTLDQVRADRRADEDARRADVLRQALADIGFTNAHITEYLMAEMVERPRAGL